MIKSISFDLDHTLYNRNATWNNLLLKFIKSFSKNINDNLKETEILKSLQEADKRATYEESSWSGMYEILIKKEVISRELEFNEFYDFIYAFFPEAIIPYPDTYQILNWCRKKGYGPSIITNGHPGLQERKIKSMKLNAFIDTCIICNLDSGIGCKPEAGPFIKLAGHLNLHPSQILYVGDNPVNDIWGARNAGMKTAWLNVMNNWIPNIEPADYEISTLCELQRIIKTHID